MLYINPHIEYQFCLVNLYRLPNYFLLIFIYGLAYCYIFSILWNGDVGVMKSFVSGLAFFILGLFLITQNTVVRTGFNLSGLTGGYNPPFGLLLLPVIIGIILLFAMEKQIWGWILIIFGLCTILLGLLMGLDIYFKPTTLYVTILMFGSVAVGIGLMIRGVIQSNKK